MSFCSRDCYGDYDDDDDLIQTEKIEASRNNIHEGNKIHENIPMDERDEEGHQWGEGKITESTLTPTKDSKSNTFESIKLHFQNVLLDDYGKDLAKVL